MAIHLILIVIVRECDYLRDFKQEEIFQWKCAPFIKFHKPIVILTLESIDNLA